MAIVYSNSIAPVVASTSGTIGTTVVDTAMVLEHAFRRVKVHPSQQTPETVLVAKESLYLLLLNLANRGLNLWCVEAGLVGLTSGQSLYEMDVGTLNVLNLVYCQPTRVTGTATSTTTSYTLDLGGQNTIRRVGLKFDSIALSEGVTLLSSIDGVSWNSVATYSKSDWVSGEWYWMELPKLTTGQYFKLSSTNTMVVNELYLATQVTDLPVVQWNRDTWSVINNKAQVGRPSTNYYLERLLTPRITLWPVPNNDYDHLQVFVQRQVQDVGTLGEHIEVPERWLEGIIWQLAVRLAFELPQVDAKMIPLVTSMADKVLIEVENDESDGAPIYLQPNMSVYTR